MRVKPSWGQSTLRIRPYARRPLVERVWKVGTRASLSSAATSWPLDRSVRASFTDEQTTQASPTEPRLSTSLEYRTEGNNARLNPSPAEFHARFRQLISTTKPLSLADQLAAVIALGNSFPHVVATVSRRLPNDGQLVSMGYDDYHPHVSFRLNSETRDFDCKLSLPAYQVPKSNSRLKAPRLNVRLLMNRDQRPSEEYHEPLPEHSLMEQVIQLARMNATVLRTIWDELSFETWESAAQTMAEAILRTLHQPLAPGLLIEKVELTVANGNSTAQTPTYSAFVSRRPSGGKHLSQPGGSRTGSKTSEQLQKDVATVPGFRSDVERAGSALMLTENFKPEDVIPSSLGLRVFRVALSWPVKHVNDFGPITKEDVRQIAERSFLQKPAGGLQSIYDAWRELARTRPVPSDVQLTAIGSYPSHQNAVTLTIRMQGASCRSLQVVLNGFDTTQLQNGPTAKVTAVLLGRPVFGEQSLSLAELKDVAVRCLKRALDNQATSDPQTVANDLGQLLSERQDELAHVVKIERAQLSFAADGNSTTFSANVSSPMQAIGGTLDSGRRAQAADAHKILPVPKAQNGHTQAGSAADQYTCDEMRQSDSGKQQETQHELNESVRSEASESKRQQVTSLQAVSTAEVTAESASRGLRGAFGVSNVSGHSSPTILALGSNVGDRLACIEEACRALDAEPNIRIIQTSKLYETKAMYLEDQAPFLNGVCEIETSLSPLELLDRTQAIEKRLGRMKTIDKGPRNIDLDILLHGDTVIKTDRLTIPHALMLERDFVLRPLQDIAGTKLHPLTGISFGRHLTDLANSEPPVYSWVPLGPESMVLRATDPLRKTKVMSIMNVTPDSFSDGGENPAADVQALQALARRHIADGAAIIDVGGQSSRPNAPDVTAEEEISRVIPAIRAIKSLPEAANIAISVDTYRASVAEAAVNAGAHIVNDISAGLLDPEMLPTVARLGCTYIMMHMRGTPATMMSDEKCSYPSGLMRTIVKELSARLDAAQKAGIRKWRLILDPGIGFSKNTEQNLAVLRNLRDLSSKTRLQRLPWLVGTSRKRFVGEVTGVAEPKDRVWGTAATISDAVRGGASIVRVHDVPEMAQVVRMADALYRARSALV